MGLVDELGGMEKALQVAADMVGIEKHKLEVLEKEEQFSFRKLLNTLSHDLIPQMKSSVRLDYRL